MAPQMENPNSPQNAADVEINNLAGQITEAEKQLETLRTKKEDLDREIEEEQKAVAALEPQIAVLQDQRAGLQEVTRKTRQELENEEWRLGQSIWQLIAARAAAEQQPASTVSSAKPAPQPPPSPAREPAAVRSQAAAPAIKYILDGDIAGPDGAPAAYNQFNVLSKASGKVLASGKTDKNGHLHVAVPARSVIVEVDGVRYPQEAEPAEAPKAPRAAAGAA